VRYALIAAVVAAVVYGLHRSAVWAERKGWIYYRKARGSSGTLGSALLEVQSLLEPSKRHVVEERRRDVAEDEESGDPPLGGPDGRSGSQDAN
jgi:hypothetical protein